MPRANVHLKWGLQERWACMNLQAPSVTGTGSIDSSHCAVGRGILCQAPSKATHSLDKAAIGQRPD